MYLEWSKALDFMSKINALICLLSHLLQLLMVGHTYIYSYLVFMSHEAASVINISRESLVDPGGNTQGVILTCY